RIPGSNVHDLAKQFRSRHIYPTRDYAHRMSARPPDIFITYDWREDFIDLQAAVRSRLSYVAKLIRERRPNLEPEAVERMVNEELGVWIDFLFIDQNARDISGEVRRVLPEVIDSAKLHFVLSETALLRSWCCYEVALFNRRPPT